MLFSSVPAVFASAIFLTSVAALPALGERTPLPCRSEGSTPSLPLDAISASNTGATALPTPSSPPAYVLLGLGYQNYTCSDAGAYVQSSPADGAIANLYDITSQLSSSNIDTITPKVFKQFESCLDKLNCQTTDSDHCQLCHTLAVATVVPTAISQVGLHFFDRPSGAQVPNFDVYKQGDYLSAKKVGDVKAPATAYKGENDLGTIDWLYLVDNGNGRSHGLSAVYRVETAGGVAPKTCTSGQQLAVPYAAQYWFEQ